MQSLPPLQSAARFVCSKCGTPTTAAFWADGVACKRCAPPYLTECIVLSVIDDKCDAPHTLIYANCSIAHVLIRTSHPECFANTALSVASAPAISIDELLEILRVQMRVLVNANHSIKSGVPASVIAERLTGSISPYMRAVGIGISPTTAIFFQEPGGSILVLDPFFRVLANDTPAAELVLAFLDDGRLAMAGLFFDNSPVLHRRTQFIDKLDRTAFVRRLPVDVCLYADITRVTAVSLTLPSMSTALLTQLPDRPDAPITLIELPCAWVLLFQQKDCPAAYAIATADVCCRLVLQLYDDTGSVSHLQVALSRTECNISCDQVPTGRIISATAFFLPFQRASSILLPCTHSVF